MLKSIPYAVTQKVVKWLNINNRRYIGSKYKLIPWIKELLNEHCVGCDSFLDVFGGTGVVTASVIDIYKSFIINDFLFSNYVIYKAFFWQKSYNQKKITEIAKLYNELDRTKLKSNYVSENYGDKYFKEKDAKLIGYIREDLKNKKEKNEITAKEYYILLASLLYSLDKSANTVGHYEAYIKNKAIKTDFIFALIEPIDLQDKNIEIYREDANELVKKVKADVAFVDPPYNSRQYSRFYHVLETITKWEKKALAGTAMKPPSENMSDYCRSTAPRVFENLIKNLDAKYIVVTYNNTYSSKSSSSKNKITLEEIKNILDKKGKTLVFEKSHQFFNTGKTGFTNHKEFLFITKVGEKDD